MLKNFKNKIKKNFEIFGLFFNISLQLYQQVILISKKFKICIGDL